MSTEWLTAQSFQHGQYLLAAINTLSIHRKLRLAGFDSSATTEELANAKHVITAFLDQIEVALNERSAGANAMIGFDARQRELAETFVRAKRRQRQTASPLLRTNLKEVKRLLSSDEPADQQVLLQCLQELRVIVEQHVHQDALRILGEF